MGCAAAHRKNWRKVKSLGFWAFHYNSQSPLAQAFKLCDGFGQVDICTIKPFRVQLALLDADCGGSRALSR